MTTKLLRSAVGRVGLASATDGELVRRYADHRDDLAFAELVHRFAPAVYALCRRHLSDPGTADDAFQAVFVLLARKAGTLLHPDRVGGWLTGTADRVARTARRRQLRRNHKLRPLDSVPEPAAEPSQPTELRVILDDELAKLPPHYRAVVTLCDVDGVPRREAAARLNIPTGTLSNRLTRARAVLGRRLLRRGVLVTAGAVVSSGSMATPPARLLASAVRVALADSPPTELLPLLIPEMTPMPRGKLLLLLVTGLTLAGGVTTGVLLLTQTSTTPPTSGAAPPTEGEPSKATKPVTPTTAVNPNAPKQPWVEPKFGEGIIGSATTADGKRVVMLQSHQRPYPSKEGGVKLFEYDTSTWEAVRTLSVPEVGSHMQMLAMTPDGRRTFVIDDDRGLFEWQRAENKLVKWADLGPLRVPGREPKPKPDGTVFDRLQLQAFRLTPDNKLLAASIQYVENGHLVGQGVRVWDVADGKLVRTIDVRPAEKDWWVHHGLHYTDDGRTVAVHASIGREAEQRHELLEFDVASGKEKRRLDLSAALGADKGTPGVLHFVYSPDGKQLVAAVGLKLRKKNWGPDPKGPIMDELKPYSYGVWLLDRETGKPVKPLIEHRSHPISGLSLSPDGKRLRVRLQLPSRMDGDHGGWNSDAEFFEVQQWDATTWQRDWVKIVTPPDYWKQIGGAAK